MNKKKSKLKFKKKQIIIISSIIIVIIAITITMITKTPNVGSIENGKANYIDRIANVTKSEDNIVIEFKNNEELIDNCIMTKEIYDKFKANDPLYNISIKDYAKLSTISSKESYNINKSIQLKLVSEDTSYTEFFAMTCGFKNKKELLKYTKAVIKLSNKEK
ncbi:MAG: hypothetical protein PUD07_01090 [bacterium]|nr:hypothetical protein [bacterium]